MKYLLILVACLVGGWDIRNAISSFKKDLYFFSGVDIMLAIWMAALIWKGVNL